VLGCLGAAGIAEDVPFEVIGGDGQARRTSWFVSKCPVKLVNYELVTRDAAFVTDERVRFDVVVLDEAQRIKNRESKTAQVVRAFFEQLPSRQRQLVELGDLLRDHAERERDRAALPVGVGAEAAGRTAVDREVELGKQSGA